MSALPLQAPKDILSSPQGLFSILEQMPQFREKAIAVIAESLQTLESKKRLAADVATHLKNTMLDVDVGDQETVEARVLAQLDELQRMLSMNKDELIRKTERMAEIEEDPKHREQLKESTGILQRGWNTVKNHKWKIIIALAAIAAGVAAWYYWDYLALLFRGGAGAGAAGAAGGMSQPKAVGNAVTAYLTEAAKNAETIGIVDHDIFVNGVAYNVKDAGAMQKLSGLLHKMAAENPDIQFTRLLSETSRASAEERLDAIFSTLPKGTNELLKPRKFLEDLGKTVTEVPE